MLGGRNIRIRDVSYLGKLAQAAQFFKHSVTKVTKKSVGAGLKPTPGGKHRSGRKEKLWKRFGISAAASSRLRKNANFPTASAHTTPGPHACSTRTGAKGRRL